MMKHLTFECLRLWRKQGILAMVLLGMVLSATNIFQQNQDLVNPHSQQSYSYLVDAWTIADYSNSIYYDVVDPDINPDEISDFDDFLVEFTPAQQRVMDAFERKEVLSDFFMGGGTEVRVPGTSHAFIQLMVEAIEEDQRPLTAEDEANIRYALVLSKHLDTYQAGLDDDLPLGTVDYLVQAGPLLYGWLPLLALLILGILSHVEDWEQGSIVYRYTLPVHRHSYILSRFGSLLGLALLYIFVILCCHLLWGGAFGAGLGDIWYPHRVMGQEATLSNVGLLARMWGLYLVRASLMISLGMALANLIRRQNLTVLLATYIFALVSLMTYYWEPLKHSWNPLYFNDRHDILGRRFNVFESYRLVAHYEMPASHWRLLMFILAILACLAISAIGGRMPRTDQLSQGKHWLLDRLPPSLTGLGFEWTKLGYNISPRLLSGSLFVLVGFFVLLIGFQDQALVHEMYSDEAFEGIESIIDQTQASIDSIKAMDSSSADAMIYASSLQSMQERVEYYSQKQEDLLNRQNSYQSADSGQFYSTFDQDINEHFYVGDLPSEYLMAGDSPYLYSRYPSKYSYAVSLDRLEELRQRGVRPIYQTHIVKTPYDQMKNPTEDALDRLYHQDRDQSFLGLTYRLLHYYRFDIMLLVVIVLVAGSGYTVEYQRGHHMDWLLTLPQSRNKILHEKLAAACLKMVSILGIFLLILLVSGLLLGGWGQGQLPIIRYLTYVDNAQTTTDFARDVYPSYEWVDLSRVILQGLSLLTMGGMFLISLAIFVSIFIKDYSKHLVVVFGLISLSWLGMVSTDFPLFIQWLPFPYLNIMPILSGEFLLNHPLKLSFGQGMWVLGLWTLMILFLMQLKMHQSND